MRTIKTMFKLSVALLGATVCVGHVALPVQAQNLSESGTKGAVAASTKLAVAAAASEGDKFAWKKPLIPVTQDFTLPNGLRVILSEDHTVPVTAVRSATAW